MRISACHVWAAAVGAALLLGPCRVYAGETTAVCRRIGLTPEVLCAAGFTTANTTLVLQRIAEAHAERQEWLSAGQAVSTLEEDKAALVASLRLDPSDAGLLSELELVSGDLRTGRTRLAAANTVLRDLALDGFASGPREVVAACIENAGRGVPTHFLVVDRSGDNWRVLRRALTAEDRAERRNHILGTIAQSILNQACAHPDVVVAERNLDLYLASIEQVFAQFE